MNNFQGQFSSSSSDEEILQSSRNSRSQASRGQRSQAGRKSNKKQRVEDSSDSSVSPQRFQQEFFKIPGMADAPKKLSACFHIQVYPRNYEPHITRGQLCQLIYDSNRTKKIVVSLQETSGTPERPPYLLNCALMLHDKSSSKDIYKKVRDHLDSLTVAPNNPTKEKKVIGNFEPIFSPPVVEIWIHKVKDFAELVKKHQRREISGLLWRA